MGSTGGPPPFRAGDRVRCNWDKQKDRTYTVKSVEDNRLNFTEGSWGRPANYDLVERPIQVGDLVCLKSYPNPNYLVIGKKKDAFEDSEAFRINAMRGGIVSKNGETWDYSRNLVIVQTKEEREQEMAHSCHCNTKCGHGCHCHCHLDLFKCREALEEDGYVVLSPEGYEVATLRDYIVAANSRFLNTFEVREALRKMVKTPPTPEPTKPFAVIRDGEGKVWRVNYRPNRDCGRPIEWQSESGRRFEDYANIPQPVTVLFEGTDV